MSEDFIQIIEHITNRSLRMEFLKYQNWLRFVCVKANTVPATVVGDAAYVFCRILLQNPPGLACAGFSIEVGHLDITVFWAESFRYEQRAYRNDTNRITHVKERFCHCFALFDKVKVSEKHTNTERA